MSILPVSHIVNRKHNNCEMVIIFKLWKNRYHPVPGLYCAEHGTLIKWLSDSDADFLIEQGVDDLGMLENEEKIYQERLQKNRRTNVDARTIL